MDNIDIRYAVDTNPEYLGLTASQQLILDKYIDACKHKEIKAIKAIARFGGGTDVGIGIFFHKRLKISTKKNKIKFYIHHLNIEFNLKLNMKKGHAYSNEQTRILGFGDIIITFSPYQLK